MVIWEFFLKNQIFVILSGWGELECNVYESNR